MFSTKPSTVGSSALDRPGVHWAGHPFAKHLVAKTVYTCVPWVGAVTAVIRAGSTLLIANRGFQHKHKDQTLLQRLRGHAPCSQRDGQHTL